MATAWNVNTRLAHSFSFVRMYFRIALYADTHNISQRHVNLCLWNQHLCWTSECCLFDHWSQPWFRQWVPSFDLQKDTVYVPDLYPPTNMSDIFRAKDVQHSTVHFHLLPRFGSLQGPQLLCVKSQRNAGILQNPNEEMRIALARSSRTVVDLEHLWWTWFWGPLSSKDQAGLPKTHTLSILYFPVLDLICQFKYVYSCYCMCVYMCHKDCLWNAASNPSHAEKSTEQLFVWETFAGPMPRVLRLAWPAGLEGKAINMCDSLPMSSYVYIYEWFQQFFFCSFWCAVPTSPRTLHKHGNFDWWT